MSIRFQSTPPSREATDHNRGEKWQMKISIHASLTGGDISLLLMRKELYISIHASLTGGDPSWRLSGFLQPHFNPRLPHGRRLTLSVDETHILLFQSTPPSREATAAACDATAPACISIHASLTGGDSENYQF